MLMDNICHYKMLNNNSKLIYSFNTKRVKSLMKRS